MGLFARIRALSEHTPKGLLYKAEHLRPAPSFLEQFARDYGYDRLCLLQPKDSLYKATFTCGMSGDSLLTASSTRDFWDGTLFTDNSDWITVRQEKLTPYLQLFSESDRDTISQLIIKRVTLPEYQLDYILLLPQDAEYDFYIPEEMEQSLTRLNEYLMA